MIGTRHKCKQCNDVDFCFKCILHAEDIHDSSHEFTIVDESFDESSAQTAEYNSDSDVASTDSSAVTIDL